jgi:GH15 family glucan-1,4-alpha-glucosidase
LGLVGLLALASAPAPTREPVTLPVDAARWKALPADGVEMDLTVAQGPLGTAALRIGYDFQGRGGWAAARLPLDRELPAHYEVRFQLRGEGPANNLEIKLVDPSGENVWWHVKRDLAWPAEWTPVRIRQRQISFAWGPLGGGEPRRLGALEVTVSAAEGGKGSIRIAGLSIVPVEPAVPVSGPIRAEASSAEKGYPAGAAVDGDEKSSWRPAGQNAAELRVDLGGVRELGGITLVWSRTQAPRHLFVELSNDGASWEGGREVVRLRDSRALRDASWRTQLMLPDGEARLLRVRLPADAGCPCALAEVIVRPLEFGASPNDFMTAIAREAPRGAFPRGFTEAAYWTVVGGAGEADEFLFSEDGTVEAGPRDFSLEPMVRLNDRLFTWADVTAEQTLADGDLPIPTVTWRIPDGPGFHRRVATTTDSNAAATAPLARLEVTPLAIGEAGRTRLVVRYRMVNESDRRLQGELFVAARPFQVNPPYQFLNLAGGVAANSQLSCWGELGREGRSLLALPTARCGSLAFDDGMLVDALAEGELPALRRVEDVEAPDAQGAASDVLEWQVDLRPGEEDEVTIGIQSRDSRLDGADDGVPPFDFAAYERAERRRWRSALDRVKLDLPEEAAPLVRSLRSNLGFIEVHRDGPAIQPGSRAYARSWIRDGALTGTALLRMGHAETAAQFARWFADYQYPDGKVPCCVDRRGADPVPENDSHGELVHLIAEVYRYTHDRAFADELFPPVQKAVDAIEALRQQRRTAEYANGSKRIYFGLLPESISHEGYSAKPVHSYWDDTFAYRGLDDAVELARALGREDLTVEWTRRRDEFRAELLASIARVRTLEHLDTLPASADLADFDSTSTTTMLDPGGLLPYLPREPVLATFERFWREVGARRDGSKTWETYTPYEIRHVGAFVRLAAATGDVRWRDRAHELLAYYLRDQRPSGWNGWPEAVHRDYRAPKFLGDLPHGWVGSDFIRSVLDLFAYAREDGALVLGAGVPPSWLARPEGISVGELGTPWGPLSYTLDRMAGFPGGPRLGEQLVGWRYWISGGMTIPPGGIVVVPPSREPRQFATVNGRAVEQAADGTVVVRQLPALIAIAALVPQHPDDADEPNDGP